MPMPSELAHSQSLQPWPALLCYSGKVKANLMMATQTRDICPAFGHSRPLLLRSCGSRCGFFWQHRSESHHCPGGTANCSHQHVLDPAVSSSSSLHCTHILLSIFLFHFSTTHLLLLVVPRVSECLGLSKSCLRSAMPCPCIMAPGRGSSQAWLNPQDCVSPDW